MNEISKEVVANMEIWNLKLINFYEEIYAWRQALPSVTIFFVKIGKFEAIVLRVCTRLLRYLA